MFASRLKFPFCRLGAVALLTAAAAPWTLAQTATVQTNDSSATPAASQPANAGAGPSGPVRLRPHGALLPVQAPTMARTNACATARILPHKMTPPPC
jgi:hypothetical protein